MGKHKKDSAATVEAANKSRETTGTGQSRPAVRVEYPNESEVISHSSYTFRIATTPGTDNMEVSIDGGAWMSCRESLGSWWYDWSGFDKGSHELVARTRMGDGLSINSAPRRFTVD